jgi:hypothetical protein
MLWGLSQTRKGRPDPEDQLGSTVPSRTTQMQIVFAFSGGVKCYQATFEERHVYEPDVCPECQTVGHLMRHGVYRRRVRDGEQVYPIPIQRWLCKTCRHTLSALPDFAVRFRWYLVGVIQWVVTGREETGASWRQLRAQAGEAPHVRTMQRWCKSLGGQASRWLGAAQIQLAQQDSASSWLDPHGEAVRAGNPVQALLGAAVHLLAWGKSRWAELAGYGWNDRLRFLGLWGSREGLGRLV